MFRLNDIEIRKVLINELRKNKGKVIEEFCICDGIARADVVVIDEELIGFEIKSDVDTFIRFKNQRECYEKTFDRNYLVVGKKYRDIEIPSGWGLIVVSSSGLEKIIKAEINNKINPQALIELLWKNELKTLLGGFKGISNKNRRKLRHIIIENFKLEHIKKYTIQALLSRQDWKITS